MIRSGTWGFVQPKPDAPQWLGTSPVVWLILGGGAVLTLFVLWESRQIRHNKGALVDPTMLRIPRLQAGLTSFFFQFLLQAGLFFVIPLFLSVALGLSAVATGVRLLPLSVALLAAAVGVPKLFPKASPRRIVRIGFALLFVAIVILVAVLDAGSGPEVVTWPLLLAGLGVGSLASQLGQRHGLLGPRLQSGEVGGVQNTLTNLGASIGTALAGTVLIAVLTTTFLGTVANDPAVPDAMASKAQVELSCGHPVRERQGPFGRAGQSRRPDRDSRCHRGGQRFGPHQRPSCRPSPCSPSSPSWDWPSPGASRPCSPQTSRRSPPAEYRRQPRRRAAESIGSAAAECHAAPGALSTGGAGHATVEAAPREPDSERELEAQQVEHPDRRNLAAPLTPDDEGAPSGCRHIRYGINVTLHGVGLPGRGRGFPRSTARWPHRRRGLPTHLRWHPEQGSLAQWIRRALATGRHSQAFCMAS